jgi:hypothetical protein
MNYNAKKMVTAVKVLGSVTLLGGLLMASGCGNDAGSGGAAVTSPNTIPAASVTTGTTAGTILTTAPVTAVSSTGATAIVIPSGTTITARDGSALSTSTPINVTTFTDLATLPAPTATNANFVLTSASGAVDVQFGDVAAGVTFSKPVTIDIPYTLPRTGCNVRVNKKDNNGYVPVSGAVCTDNANGGGVATVQVSSLCTFVLNPVWTNGTTGSTGGSGLSGF